ncbi:MAG: DsbA family protein, partial [Rhodomicrobium sp.]
QDALEPEDLLQYAADLDLDVDQFASDLSSHTFERRVREDFMSGVRSGVSGTPTFFINGLRHDGPWDFDTLASEILEAEEPRLRRMRA